MCGIVGIVSHEPVNQQIYDALLLLQHRGQDSTGIATADGPTFHLAKAKGQVREAFRTRDMRSLLGNVGLGHVRYVTKGDAANEQETQPFYVNAPYGIILVHNGNLTNTRELAEDLFHVDRRHVNSTSDTEMLLNVFATELQGQISGLDLDPDQVFNAVAQVHERIEGSYAVIAMIAGHGLLAFRDPYGIRPLVLGRRQTGMVAMTGSSPRNRSFSRPRATRSCATWRRERRSSSRRRASCSVASARATRGSCRARSSTCTSPGPTRS